MQLGYISSYVSPIQKGFDKMYDGRLELLSHKVLTGLWFLQMIAEVCVNI